MSGKMILSLLTSIVESLNIGSVPVIESTWSYVVFNESSKYFNDAVLEFKSQLSNYCIDIKNLSPEKFSSFIMDLNSFSNELQKVLLDDFSKKIQSIDEGNLSSQIEKLKQKVS